MNDEKTALERPTLIKLFTSALNYTKEEDRKRNTDTTFELILENQTFHERVVCNFIILASGFYSKEETKQWIEENLLDKEDEGD